MTVMCPECGTVNEDEDEYCRNCGINLTDSGSEKRETTLIGKLFCWTDSSGSRIAKTKIVSWISFILGAYSYESFYFNIYSVENGFDPFAPAFCWIFAGLIFAVPVFCVAFVIHKIFER